MRRWSIRMCQNFWPMFIGSVCAAVAAVLTALKTGNVLLWPCAALIIGIGTVRAFQMRKYERRTEVLTFQQAKHLEPRYAIGAMVYAGVLGVWCFLTIFGNDDAVAHMICVAVDDRLHRRRRGPQLRPSQADPISHPAGLRPDVAGAGAACRFFLHRPRRAAGAVLRRPQGHQPQPARHLRQGTDVEFPRSGAGPPVRYRAEQHAAWALHVSRRRPACGDELPLQRNDEPLRGSHPARRQRARHCRGLHRLELDFDGERQDDPVGDRQHAGPRHHHHRS